LLEELKWYKDFYSPSFNYAKWTFDNRNPVSNTIELVNDVDVVDEIYEDYEDNISENDKEVFEGNEDEEIYLDHKIPVTIISDDDTEYKFLEEDKDEYDPNELLDF